MIHVLTYLSIFAPLLSWKCPSEYSTYPLGNNLSNEDPAKSKYEYLRLYKKLYNVISYPINTNLIKDIFCIMFVR